MTRTSTSRFSRPALAKMLPLGLLLLISIQSAFADPAVLREVRVGPHRSFDRLVLELDSKVDYSIQTDTPGRLSIRIRNADVVEGFQLPKLPDHLDCIRFLEAYRLGAADLELDVALKNRFFHTGFVLDGKPWRLVIDFSIDPIEPPADAAKSKPAPEPEYVPGDRPIETRFAETQPPPEVKPEILPETEPEPVLAEQTDPDSCIEPPVESLPEPIAVQTTEIASSEVTADSVAEPVEQFTAATPADSQATAEDSDLSKANEVLREFYLVLGDTERANHFAESADDIVPFVGEQVNAPYLLRAVAHIFVARPWLFFAAALLFGLLGGLAGLWVNAKFFRIGMNPASPKPPKPAKQKKAKPFEVAAPAAELAEELEDNIDTLEQAVNEEKIEEEPDLGPLPEAYQNPPEELVTVDEEVKESAMERRVKRVLELSKEGADIPSIAKQLEMSQDEVKLILDLN